MNKERQGKRGYRVAQAQTPEGLQSIVNNMLAAGFKPVGGVSVTLIGTMHDEPIVLHTQGMFCSAKDTCDDALLRAALLAWSRGVERWQENHQSHPTVFSELAHVMDEVKGRLDAKQEGGAECRVDNNEDKNNDVYT